MRRALPAVAEHASLTPADAAAQRQVEDAEAGAEDDRVDRVLGAVGGDQRALADLADRGRDDLDVRLRQRGVPRVRRADALAAERVGGREQRSQLGVRHLAAQVRERRAPREREQARVHEAEHGQFTRAVDPAAHRGLRRRQRAVEALRARGDGVVTAREHPGRRALEDGEPAGARLDLGDELDRRGARADDGDPLAGEVVVVVPRRGVERRAPEVLEPGDVGQRRLVQRPGRRDEHLRREGAAARRDPPAAGAGVPVGARDLVPEADPPADARRAGERDEVVLDLAARREQPRPARVRRERQRVEVRGDVARDARVRVLPPRAADLTGLLEHDDVGDAGLAQPDREAQPAEARADDGDAHVLRRAAVSAAA